MSEVREVFLGHRAPKEARSKNAYDFTFKSIKDGRELSLSHFKGKVLIIVNTASLCGFTKQYHDLQICYEKYRKQGLEIIAVPSNNFGRQEPKDNTEIKKFCRREFGIDFTLMQKESVTGKYAHPFYVWAKEVVGSIASPKWNFHKYVINRNGELVDFFVPFTKVTSKRATKVIERLLAEEVKH